LCSVAYHFAENLKDEINDREITPQEDKEAQNQGSFRIAKRKGEIAGRRGNGPDCT
jgi:hypothetical protein